MTLQYITLKKKSKYQRLSPQCFLPVFFSKFDTFGLKTYFDFLSDCVVAVSRVLLFTCKGGRIICSFYI